MTTTPSTPPRADRRAIRILARSLARELAAEGFDTRQLITLASELIDEATFRLRAARDQLTSDCR